MTETTEEHPSKILRFFVFNSSWSPGEDYDEQKIIYYYPKEEETKSKHVGIIEALIRFLSVFSEKPAKTQHSQKVFFLIQVRATFFAKKKL